MPDEFVGGGNGGSQTFLPASTGIDDTAALNALLALGGNFAGKQGESYKISSPLVLKSNTTLDMNNCTITLLAGNNCRMVQTAETTTGRNITDGVATAASTTFTSATAAFVGGDVGTSITIQGAAPFGGTLFTTIASVTNGTTVVLTDTVTTSVAAAVCGIGTRSHDIHIDGGTWDRGTNNGAVGTARHSIVFRKVDRCSMKNASYESAGGKFAVLFQSCTDYTSDQPYMLATFSDGVHIEGPCSRGQITNVRGTCGDDMVGVTPKDWTGYTWGDEGDILDLEIDGVFGTNTTKCLVRVNGGAGKNCKGVTVRTVHGTSQAIAILIGDDTNDAATVGGLLDNVVLDDIRVQSSSGNPQIKLNPSNGKRFTLSGLHYEVNALTGQNCIGLDAATVIASLEVTDCEIVDGLNGSALVNVQGTCTILSVSVVKGTPVAGAQIVKLDDANNASVTKLLVDGITCAWQTVGGSVVRAIKAGGQTLTKLHMSNVSVTGASWLADLGTTTDVHFSGVSTDQGGINVRATGVVTVYADGACKMGASAVAGGGVLISKSFGFQVDVALLTQHDGDMAYNTNAASGPLGPVISDGTRWRRAELGSVKTGTATLVAGTVTVANTSITANSIIRLSRKTMGGTPGALYISALTAATSFAITSTNAADTSVVYYEIIQY